MSISTTSVPPLGQPRPRPGLIRARAAHGRPT